MTVYESGIFSIGELLFLPSTTFCVVNTGLPDLLLVNDRGTCVKSALRAQAAVR